MVKKYPDLERGESACQTGRERIPPRLFKDRRLSRDDENYGDSVSIETQRKILQQYAREHSLCIYSEYVDDGWSGTNFERPRFKRMMDNVDSGRVILLIRILRFFRLLRIIAEYL